MPRAPDWVCIATDPRVGGQVEKVALSPMAVLATPTQLGPTSRIPFARARSRSSASAAAPSRPISPKPALNTTTLLTPAVAQSATTSITAAVGTATTASSIGSGTSLTVG